MTARPLLVVGYKDSAESQHALGRAISLAKQLGADVHVVHVVDLADFPLDPDSGDWEDQGRRKLDLIREQVGSRLSELTGRTSYATLPGDPAHVLHDVAAERGALMIIVGVRSGASSPLSRLFSSSVSRGLTRRMDCPVLLVPLHDTGVS